jgi:hypothetical protein
VRGIFARGLEKYKVWFENFEGNIPHESNRCCCKIKEMK